jgi:hypothetical protein
LVEDHIQHLPIGIEEVVGGWIFDVREVIVADAEEEDIRKILIFILVRKGIEVVGNSCEEGRYSLSKDSKGIFHDSFA